MKGPVALMVGLILFMLAVGVVVGLAAGGTP